MKSICRICTCRKLSLMTPLKNNQNKTLSDRSNRLQLPCATSNGFKLISASWIVLVGQVTEPHSLPLDDYEWIGALSTKSSVQFHFCFVILSLFSQTSIMSAPVNAEQRELVWRLTRYAQEKATTEDDHILAVGTDAKYIQLFFNLVKMLFSPDLMINFRIISDWLRSNCKLNAEWIEVGSGETLDWAAKCGKKQWVIVWAYIDFEQLN